MSNYENVSATAHWMVSEPLASSTLSGINSTSGSRTCPPDGRNHDWLVSHYVDIAVLSIAFIFALSGNLCVLFAVWRRRAKSTRMHMFLVHLAIADIMVAMFQLLPELLIRLACGFHAGDVACRLVKYLQVVGMYGSTYVLVCTAMDRYRAIKYPMKTFKQSKKRVHVAIFLAWVLSFLLSIPQLFFFGLNAEKRWCRMYRMPLLWKKVYVTWYFVSVLVFPVAMLTFFYGMIAKIIFTNLKQKRMASAPTRTLIKPNGNDFAPRASNFSNVSRAKLKTVKMTFVIVILFAVCYTPFFTVQIFGVWGIIDRNALVSQIFHLLASLNSCVNPWVYMGFSGHLLVELKPTFMCGKKRKQNTRSFRSTVATGVTGSSFVSRLDSAPIHQDDREFIKLQSRAESH